MAGIADYLRQFGGQINQGLQGLRPGLEQGFANPLTHAGLGIYMGSQQGGPGAAAGFMQGMQGYNQMQEANTVNALRKQQLERTEKESEAEEARKRAVMQMLKSNPQAMESLRQRNPIAAGMLETTGDISSMKGTEAFGMLDPFKQAQTENWRAQRQEGSRRSDIAERGADLNELKLKIDYNRHLQTMGLKSDQLGFEVYKQQRKEQDASAEKEANARLANVNLGGQLDKVDTLSGQIDRLVNDPSFDALYGPAGQTREFLSAFGKMGEGLGLGADMAMAFAGSGVPDARAMRDQLVDTMVFRTIQDLKDASETGATGLGQIAIPEFNALTRAGSRLKDARTPEAAREAAKELNDSLSRMRKLMVDRNAAKAPAGTPPPNATPPGQGSGQFVGRATVQQLAEKRGVPVQQIMELLRQQGIEVR